MLNFLTKNLRWIVGGLTLTFFSSLGQTYFISASIAEWQSEFSLSHGEFGRLYMFATLGSAACLPFIGRIMDVMPAHRVILIVAPLLAGASLLAGFAMTVLPVTSAAAICPVKMARGKFHGLIHTITPRPWYSK